MIINGINVRNLTPHTINILNTSGEEVYVIPAEGVIPRCSQENVEVGSLGNGVPIYQCVYGEVEDLPEETPNTLLIVSRLVVSACPTRKDLVSPGPLMRNAEGQPIGCMGLAH